MCVVFACYGIDMSVFLFHAILHACVLMGQWPRVGLLFLVRY